MHKDKQFGFILFPVFLFLVSWLRYFTTMTLKVDGNNIEPLWLNYVTMTLLILSYIWFYRGLYDLIFNQDFQLSQIRWYVLVFLGSSFFTLPLLSNDVFSLWAYAEAYLRNISIYKVFDANLHSSFGAYVHENYAQLACKYGPINVMLLCGAIKIAGTNLWPLFWMTKLVFLPFAFGYAYVSYLMIRDFGKRYLIWLFIPIWFVQGLGQFHNDLISVFFIALSVYLLQKDKLYWGILMLNFAVLAKLTYLPFLGLPLMMYWQRNKIIIDLVCLKIIFVQILSLCLIGFLVYVPFIESFMDVFLPILALNTERPAGTFSDLASYIMSFFNGDLQGNFLVTVPVFKRIALVLWSALSIWYVRNYKRTYSPHLFLLHFFIILIFIYSHRFLAWYLMVIPIFVVMEERVDWLKWIYWMSFWVMFGDFAIAVDTDNLLGQVLMVLGTVIPILGFFYLLPSRLKPQ
ncbi:MAG: hypothetical protein MUE53_04930 [Chitinophagales bacterium]|nr:hypothetical protein [Chitinophagales bacterium]